MGLSVHATRSGRAPPGEGEFFGEGALAGQLLRMGSATPMTDCEVLRIDKKATMLALHRAHTFSDLFVAYLLARHGPKNGYRCWTDRA
jgi:hypothetical protein